MFSSRIYQDSAKLDAKPPLSDASRKPESLCLGAALLSLREARSKSIRPDRHRPTVEEPGKHPRWRCVAGVAPPELLHIKGLGSRGRPQYRIHPSSHRSPEGYPDPSHGSGRNGVSRESSATRVLSHRSPPGPSGGLHQRSTEDLVIEVAPASYKDPRAKFEPTHGGDSEARTATGVTAALRSPGHVDDRGSRVDC